MKRKLSRVALFVVMAAALFTIGGCYTDGINCLRGNGQLITENRSSQVFTQIVSNGSFDVFVMPSVIHEVRVESESNLIGFIKTYVSGDRLIIETASNRCINNTLPIRVTVYTPYANSFELNSSGYMQAFNLNVEEVFAFVNGSGKIDLDFVSDYMKGSISGSGTIEATGITNTTDLQISGSGNIYAYDLDQNKCYASISGSGNMYVFPNQLCNAIISGSGNIYYRGNPQIVQQITGSGRIIKQ
ncbi:MAG: DUF2807 domain-containing protein [Bacteroidales bacterium]|nr:DUF2807 domain-containing protein [Bacteroidales bacterium]